METKIIAITTTTAKPPTPKAIFLFIFSPFLIGHPQWMQFSHVSEISCPHSTGFHMGNLFLLKQEKNINLGLVKGIGSMKI